MTPPETPQPPKTVEELGAALTAKHRLFAEAYARDPDGQRVAMAMRGWFRSG